MPTIRMTSDVVPDEDEDQRLQQWLLLLLRFAITRRPIDRVAVIAMSQELDSIGGRPPATPRFFVKSANEVCQAISANNGIEDAVLRKHIARIAHPRLARAFRAAIQTERAEQHRSRKSQDLWKGLPAR
jgi:hypothetical protein